MSVPTLLQGTPQNVTVASAHHESTAISANEAPGKTMTVRLAATSNCWYLCSLAGTAATTSNATYLPLGIVEYIRVPNNTIISVIRDTADGTLNVTPMPDVSTP
jgi:hypothetical protein